MKKGFVSVIGIFCFIMALCAAEKQSDPEKKLSFPSESLAKAVPSKFDVHVKDIPDEGVPVVKPWRTIRLDPEYRGGWVVTVHRISRFLLIWIATCVMRLLRDLPLLTAMVH